MTTDGETSTRSTRPKSHTRTRNNEDMQHQQQQQQQRAQRLSELKEVTSVNQEIDAHHRAFRAMVTFLCDKLAGLEATLKTFGEKQTSMDERLTHLESRIVESHKATTSIKREIEHREASLTNMFSSLNENHRQVSQRLDAHQESVGSRFQDVAVKLEELPRTLSLLIPPPQVIVKPEPPPPQPPMPQPPQPQPVVEEPPPVVAIRESDKIKVQVLKKRSDEANVLRHKRAELNEHGTLTDLVPLTIPDEMKERIERRIRERQNQQEAQAAVELAQAYARLQITNGGNNARLQEMRLALERCQQEVQRAFKLIQSSNLHLFNCIQAKAERFEFQLVDKELQHLRKQICQKQDHRDAEKKFTSDFFWTSMFGTAADVELLIRGQPSAGNNGSPLKPREINPSEIPVLRVSLLELCRNFSMLKNQARHRKLSMPLKAHLDSVIMMLDQAYVDSTRDPIDYVNLSKQVFKIASVLASDLSAQVLQALRKGEDSLATGSTKVHVGTTAKATARNASAHEQNDTVESQASGELAAAICDYSDSFSNVILQQPVGTTDPKDRPESPMKSQLIAAEQVLVLSRYAQMERELHELKSHFVTLRANAVTKDKLHDAIRKVEARVKPHPTQSSIQVRPQAPGSPSTAPKAFPCGATVCGILGSPKRNPQIRQDPPLIIEDPQWEELLEKRRLQSRLDPLQIHKMTSHVRNKGSRFAKTARSTLHDSQPRPQGVSPLDKKLVTKQEMVVDDPHDPQPPSANSASDGTTATITATTTTTTTTNSSTSES